MKADKFKDLLYYILYIDIDNSITYFIKGREKTLLVRLVLTMYDCLLRTITKKHFVLIIYGLLVLTLVQGICRLLVQVL